MIICTSIYAADLPKAIIMAESVRKHMPDARLVACLVEREMPANIKNQAYFDELILAKDLGFDDFDKFIFKYSAAEASDVVKGQLFAYLMGKFGEQDIFIFLDPDIEVFGPFVELLDALNNNDIVVLPHSYIAEREAAAVADNELWALRNGVYDLGCLALKRSKKAQALIEWWKLRLDKFCYEDVLDGVPMGTFTEQRWFCLVPGFFDVHIFKHAGYNFGPRNLSTRKMVVHDAGYMVNGTPLRFCHFWGVDSGASDDMIRKYLPDLSNPFYILKDKYKEQLKKITLSTTENTAWTYNCFTSGEMITDEGRDIYRREPWRAGNEANPFELSNADLLNITSTTTKPLLTEVLSETNKNTFEKALRYFQRYGFKKTLVKIAGKCLRK